MNYYRKLTEAECEILRRHPAVKVAIPRRFALTYEFRTELYEYWNTHGQSPQAVRNYMSANGIDICLFNGTCIISDLSKTFNRHGSPTTGKNRVPRQYPGYTRNEEDDAYLIGTGKFIPAKNGISFSEAFAEELFRAYPEQSIEDGLIAAGIDPVKVGYQRICALKRRFDDHGSAGRKITSYSAEVISEYSAHPYVKRITQKQFVLKPAFYSDAHHLIGIMNVQDILKLFEIEPDILSSSTRNAIRYRLIHWKEGKRRHNCEVTDQNRRILRNVMNAVDRAVEASLKELGEMVPSMTLEQKKRLCQYIDTLGKDPGRRYTKRYIFSLLGISKSAFYSCLNRSDYGIQETTKNMQDERDVKVIQEVIDYKGYPKGTRMIYMMMKKITGRQFGINKIRRLKQKYGIICPVRKANASRRAAQELLEKNRKDNKLKRTFRLHRPSEVFLSDVTYLDFGNNKRAYGSAILDAVTGKLITFVVSEHNDLSLADKTLNWIVTEKNHRGALFHTDQGSLYLSDRFQERLNRLGMIQSMSKRGNCWDNAPQESFFGHFKDEVDYSRCRTIEELDLLLYDYMQYFNKERCQWTRNRMTPVQYQRYLNSMSDAEFAAYMEKEETKYRKMQKNAAAKAKARAKTIGPD